MMQLKTQERSTYSSDAKTAAEDLIEDSAMYRDEHAEEATVVIGDHDPGE